MKKFDVIANHSLMDGEGIDDLRVFDRREWQIEIGLDGAWRELRFRNSTAGLLRGHGTFMGSYLEPDGRLTLRSV